MIVKEVQAKAILSTSKVYSYAVNPYTGCQHACSYCYARFMKRFTGHREPWGAFVDVKVNAAELLRVEIQKKKPGKVWVSGVCDPYQPLEKRYGLTRECLRTLTQSGWPVAVQTRSPLVLRDLDILTAAADLEVDLEVGLTVTTADDSVKRLFEPQAPPIQERLRALDGLHRAGIRTFAMIAPLLPGAEELGDLLADKVDNILIDRMNYTYGEWLYRKYGFEDKLTDDFFQRTARELVSALKKSGVPCRVVF
jgi:DNA repair photolyase